MLSMRKLKAMHTRIIALILFLASGYAPVFGQQTTLYNESQRNYKRGLELFSERLYGLAQERFERVNDPLASADMQRRPVQEPAWPEMRSLAALYEAKSAVRLDQPHAERLVYDFLRTYAPSPIAGEAALEVGDYYFNKKEFEEAIGYYNMAPPTTPGSKTAQEIQFKKGYSYFVTKNFAKARYEFQPLQENPASDYYIPANYYYGCAAFFEKDYNGAIRSFQRCEKAPEYQNLAPYYLCQIYFAQEKYQEVIRYGEPKTKESRLSNLAEINQLVGQSHYELGDLRKAAPFLAYAQANNAKMRPADYYQLGFAQYIAGDYPNAITNFEKLGPQDSLLGQNALYHKGDAYIQTGNKFNARTAFGMAGKMPYNPELQEDALITFAKLSYELKYDRDALDALQKIPQGSPHRDKAQGLMADVLMNTRDYERALSMLDGIPNRTDKLNGTYQELSYMRGIQLYQNGQKDEARRFFNRSLEYPINKRTVALTSYWLGSIANENKEYNASKNHINAFLTQARPFGDLPDESSLFMGQYIQGYNLMQLKDYAGAQAQFRYAIDGISKGSSYIQSEQIKNGVRGDAVLRAGDCSFKLNKYPDAVKYYDEAINRKYDGFEYALYQKAIIRGLQNAPLDKIVLLEDLIQKYPYSRHTDEALLQLGETYMNLGKYTEAYGPLRTLTTEYKDRSGLVNQGLLKLGLASFNQGNLSAAANYYKQVIANKPETTEAKEALSALEEIYVKNMNRPDEYFNYVQTIPGYNINDATRDSITFRAAMTQFERGNHDQAIQSFTNYLAQFPKSPNALTATFHRGESYAHPSVNRLDQAIADYKAVSNKGPGTFYARASERAALVCLQTKDYGQAYTMARRWEDAAPNEASRFDAQLLVMQCAYENKSRIAVDEYAAKILGSRIASNNHRATAAYYQGKMAYDNQEFTRAYPLFETVTKYSTAEIMAESYHRMIDILVRQQRYAQADDLVTEANKASAGYDDWIARNLILIADASMAQGDWNSASAALEAVLENYKGGDKEILQTANARYETVKKQIKPTTTKPPGSGNLLDMDYRN
jgi:tetratricopeptide (TPR) repeat protein